MMYPQARNFAAEYQAAGFHDVTYERVPRKGRDTWRLGYVLSGTALMNGKRVRFEIRSPEQARRFLQDYRAQQEEVEVTSGLA